MIGSPMSYEDWLRSRGLDPSAVQGSTGPPGIDPNDPVSQKWGGAGGSGAPTAGLEPGTMDGFRRSADIPAQQPAPPSRWKTAYSSPMGQGAMAGAEGYGNPVVSGIVQGGIQGGAIGGPWGAAIGAIFGGVLGFGKKKEEEEAKKKAEKEAKVQGALSSLDQLAGYYLQRNQGNAFLQRSRFGG